MPYSRLARRKLIHASLALAGTSLLLGQGSAAATLPPTPWQTPGPFYPLSFPPDSDNDLIHISGHTESAKGIVTRITGRILDHNGHPFRGRGSRFGNATRLVAITTSEMAEATGLATRIFRATVPRRPTLLAAMNF